MGGSQADVLRWTGAADDGNMATAGNWTTHAGSPTTTTPSDGESVLFDHRSATGVYANLDQSALELAGFAVMPGFRFQIGTASAPLLIDVDHTNSATVDPYCRIYGMGQYVKLSGSITNATVSFPGAGKFHLSGGSITNPVFAGGTVIVEADGLIAPASGSGVAKALAGSVTIRQHAGSGTSDTATMLALGGEVNNYRTANTIEVGGSAVLRQLVDAAIDTKIDQYGGTVYMNSSGTIAQFNGYAGLATTKGALNDFTISAQELHLNTHTMDLKSAPIVVTETAAAVTHGFARVGSGPVGFADL